MKRGEIIWEDKITIVRDEVSGKPKVTCEGLWSGKDRRMISRMLLKEMRASSNAVKHRHKQADLNEKRRKEALEKTRAAKKVKKELKEESENVRGQSKSE